MPNMQTDELSRQIGKYMCLEGEFKGNLNVTYAVIPEGVTETGDYAFLECSGITSITIPESVTRIGDAFEYA